ncbi:hypothetical protein LV476_07825 [Guyparkeria hydrothermalis]|uniref:hypothetical protein n=1 Tax=Guyparkeria hydrothermalis TaxID=923 RepID=UPI00201FE664|nr:hypothetical protein [Guyparkeria hydrothermalis]MCL7744842.1 hypothetical protein [Guyparkeria hydrothermalis]
MGSIEIIAISILALLVSVTSAFYAKRAVDQAAWSNRVNLHEPRKRIYEGLVLYRHLFGDYDLHPTEDEIQDFYVKVAMPARLYFPAEIADEIYGIYETSFAFYKRIEAAESGESGGSKWEPINQFKEQSISRLDNLIPRVIAATELRNT